MRALVRLFVVLVGIGACSTDEVKPFGNNALLGGTGGAASSSTGGATSGTGGARAETGGAGGARAGTGGTLAAGGVGGIAGGPTAIPGSGGGGTGGSSPPPPCPSDAQGFAYNTGTSCASSGHPLCYPMCDLNGQHVVGCGGGPDGRSCVASCSECAP